MAATIVAGSALIACSLFSDFGEFDTETGDDAAAPGTDGGTETSTTVEGGTDAGPPDAPADGGSDSGSLDPYAAEVLKDTPVAWFRFEETAGPDAKDEMGGAPAKYSLNGVTLGAAGVRGSRAVHLDGVSGRISLGNRFAFVGKAAHTIEIWFSVETLDTNVRYIWSHRGAAQPDTNWFALYYNDSAGLFERRAALNTYCDLPTPAASVRQHVVLSFGATARLLLNGGLVDEATMIGDIADPGDAEFVIGDRTSGQFNKLKGTVDELAIYDKALSDARIEAHYDAATNP